MNRDAQSINATGSSSTSSIGSTTPIKKRTPAVAVDERRLEYDAVYRFQYLANVIGLTESDHELLRNHYHLIEPCLSTIVEQVYLAMFSHEAMKRHFLPRHEGYQGALAKSMSELSLESDQTLFRKKRLHEYFTKLCTAEWDATFAILVDLVGRMHTAGKGNASLQVPVIQVVALSGVINDLFLEMISGLKISMQSRTALQRTFTKLFWVQNGMFVRHWIS